MIRNHSSHTFNHIETLAISCLRNLMLTFDFSYYILDCSSSLHCNHNYCHKKFIIAIAIILVTSF